MASPHAEALLASPISLELFYLIEWRQETSLTDDELMERAFEARQIGSVYRGDYAENLAFLRSRASTYDAMAEDVAARMGQWWDPLNRALQVWAHPTSAAPTASDLVTELTQFSVETPKPRRALWTCTVVPRIVTPWIKHGERPLQTAHTWLLTVSAQARVFEVASPEDWWELAHSYPARTPGFKYAMMPLPSHPGVLTSDRSSRYARVDPDWEALANDWDGVHVSMAGVMTAEDVTFERDSVVTELRGWDVESTVWLRWVFDSVEEIGVDGRAPGPGS